MKEKTNILIWGGTGDLARRKLLPALSELAQRGQLPRGTRILGLGRRAYSREAYQAIVAEALSPMVDRVHAEEILANCDYHCLGDHDAYKTLKTRLDAWDFADGESRKRIYYLAMPPKAFEEAVEEIGKHGLNEPRENVRLVVEKPFGTDHASAVALNQFLHKYFDESAIYRIDHYLGKDTVQNLLVLRFANTVFESLWNRDRISKVEILVGESLGVEDRANYYDGIGALRDMLQNHLTQVLSFVAMEVPARMDADSIRSEKVKVLHSLLPITAEDITWGQYGAGEIDGKPVIAYADEPGVAPNSETETFASLRVFIDNWRWQGVPFILTTGKRLPRRCTRIAVHFRPAPICLFQDMGTCLVGSNTLLITLQPNEGFEILMDVKVPGTPARLKRIPLAFQYKELGQKLPDAYETLLIEILKGDQTLFVRADEVERAWQFYDSALALRKKPVIYEAGTWGPSLLSMDLIS